MRFKRFTIGGQERRPAATRFYLEPGAQTRLLVKVLVVARPHAPHQHRSEVRPLSILRVRIIGDPVLRTVAEEVTDFGPELAKLIGDMVQTMQDVRGVGLAAPQIGVSKRIFTYAVSGEEGHVINPVLSISDDFQPDEPEGCLSVPGLGYGVRRSRVVRLTGVDMFGETLDIEATGLLAKCFQHETDHLDGKLYVDRLVGEDKRTAMQAIRNLDYQALAAHTVTKRAKTVASAFGAGAK